MVKKMTTEEFIEKAKMVHGETYDYSNIEYVNSQTNIKIVCKIHKIFQQTPNGHLMGRGCRKCGTTKRSNLQISTSEQFIEKAKKIYGSTYNYSNVEYVNSKTKVNIICKEHGEFSQTPNGHLSGRGCKSCGLLKISKKRRRTIEQFIIEAKKIHGETYDYSNADYITTDTKVNIICKEHGEFSQTPTGHLSGHGCRKCGIIRMQEKQSSTIEQFINKAKLIHGSTYDYSNVEYVNSHTKVNIICNKHGYFGQTPSSHLNGSGCMKCGNITVSQKLSSSTEQFIEKARRIHGDTYNYSNAIYNGDSKILITCKIHGDFFQTPSNHLTGRGCNKCGIITTSGKLSSSTEQFIEKAKLVHGERYNYYNVKYIQSKTEIIILCNIHGQFLQKPSVHLQGNGCSDCINKNEAKTRTIIEELTGHIFYTTRRIIKKDGIVYELDGYNKQLKIAFEYQGEQHYIYYPMHFHRKGKFMLIHQQIRDYIKAQECEKRGIKLVSIPYWVEDKRDFIIKSLTK